MSCFKRERGICWALAWLCSTAVVLCSCGIVGPAVLSRGRPAYNEAIARTEDEQMLMAIVHSRYGETVSLLAVTSITANLRVGATLGAEVGIGADENFSGNLVPFSAGAVYEENPTISYAPVQGEQYLKQLLSPIPLDLLTLLVRSLETRGGVFQLLVSRVNDLNNPDFLASPEAQPDARFARFVELLSTLEQTGVAIWVEDPEPSSGFALAIRDAGGAQDHEVAELLALLGLPQRRDRSRSLILPVVPERARSESAGLTLTTRSVYDLVEILAATIDVPETHGSEGLSLRYPPLGPAGRQLHIRHAEKKPKHALVRVQYRGSWFYIDETDQPTKEAFRLVSALWAASIASATQHIRNAPVLTLPASR
jgi:hypothetical protein